MSLRLLAALRRHAEEIRIGIDDLESEGVMAETVRSDRATVLRRIDRLEAQDERRAA